MAIITGRGGNPVFRTRKHRANRSTVIANLRRYLKAQVNDTRTPMSTPTRTLRDPFRRIRVVQSCRNVRRRLHEVLFVHLRVPNVVGRSAKCIARLLFSERNQLGFNVSHVTRDRNTSTSVVRYNYFSITIIWKCWNVKYASNYVRVLFWYETLRSLSTFINPSNKHRNVR